MSETEHENVEAAGDQQDADWYHEWFVQDGSIRSRGWTPLIGVDHDGISDWRQNCLEAIESGIDPEDHEGEVVFRSWAYFEETGISWDALVDEIEDPEIPQ